MQITAFFSPFLFSAGVGVAAVDDDDNGYNGVVDLAANRFVFVCVLMKARFVAAAVVCKECGFDGIQLHSAHGYLLSRY